VLLFFNNSLNSESHSCVRELTKVYTQEKLKVSRETVGFPVRPMMMAIMVLMRLFFMIILKVSVSEKGRVTVNDHGQCFFPS